MIEPISIITATAGVVTLLTSAAKAIKAIHSLMDKYQHYDSAAIMHSSELESLVDMIKIWRDLWRVDSRSSESFHEKLWGRDGCQIVTVCVMNIEYLASKINSSIQHDYRQAMERQGTTWSLINRLTSNEDSGATERGLWYRKLKNTLFNHTIVELHLQDLRKQLVTLNDLSIGKLRKRCGHSIPFDKEQELDVWINDFHRGDFFFTLEEDSCRYSEALYHELANSYSAELCLDDLVNESTVNRTADPRERNHANILYDVRLQQGSSITKFTILAILRQDGDRSCVGPRLRLADVDRVGNCQCSKLNCRRRFQLSSNCNHYQVEIADFENRFAKQLKEQSYSLRSLFCQRRNQSINKFHGSFARMEKISLGYALARFTFIMLRTCWVSKLCLCNIFCERSDERQRYRVYVGHTSRPLNPQFKYASMQLQPWCEQGSQYVPLRQLGLLLLEIAIGEPLAYATFDDQMNVVELGYSNLHDLSVGAQPVLLEEAMEDVRSKTSPRYANAVQWCLMPDLSSTEITESTMKGLFDNALKPLHVEYRGQLIQRPGVLRRERLRQRANQDHRT